MTKKTVYLASPYGFSNQWNEKLLPEFVAELNGLGAEVWEPFERNKQIDFSTSGWAYKVAMTDLQDVKNADAIFAIINGTPPDEGVSVEIGVAIALGKPTFLFRDDFRRCTDSEEYPLNLMLFAGLPVSNWKDSYYTSIDDIKNPEKALFKWLKGASLIHNKNHKNTVRGVGS
tara:strand:+ start:5639 stop:6157 length:519 start_codon:yes stop_codon:yes gene_type:complete